MPRSEPARRGQCDWPAWIALVWALACGLLYTLMVIEHRGPTARALLGLTPSAVGSPADSRPIHTSESAASQE